MTRYVITKLALLFVLFEVFKLRLSNQIKSPLSVIGLISMTEKLLEPVSSRPVLINLSFIQFIL